MLEQIAYAAQIVGVIAVVATLIYLAIQVRQGTALLRSESRQAQLANDQTGVYKFVEHPDLGRIFSQTETPSFEDKTKLIFWMIGQMRAREFEWLQYKSGAMDKEAWESYRGVIFFVLGTERTRDLWTLCNPYFNVDFVKMVAAMMEGIPPTDYWEKLQQIG
jgi:hypothetical protein|tara:strand:- start:412 stop:897 length:486 start_codon:yes stop_codon:yes gene_type:complete